jgi:hypothetical protein
MCRARDPIPPDPPCLWLSIDVPPVPTALPSIAGRQPVAGVTPRDRSPVTTVEADSVPAWFRWPDTTRSVREKELGMPTVPLGRLVFCIFVTIVAGIDG